jgi:hypothetical protein
VLNGKPVADVKVTALGVPKLGVVNTGDVVRAMLPDPDTFCPNAPATPVPKEVIPVPPLPTAKVPATVTAPDVAVEGVNPVEPKEIVWTLVVEAEDARSFTVPALFLKYSFSSFVFKR